MFPQRHTGTASSYARKYALNGLLLIDDTKDSDTDEVTGADRNDNNQNSNANKQNNNNGQNGWNNNGGR